MKKGLIRLACALGAAIAVAACSTAQQATATGDLQKLQTLVSQGCQVVQPTLTAVAALDPSVSGVATANGLFCATASSITVTSVQTLLATGIPAIDAAITQSTLIPAANKPLYIAALGIFQLTVQNAMNAFQGTGVVAPASTPAASAPVAASS